MRLKGYPRFFDLVDSGQAEHLEPAAVGEDRPGPLHEGVQPAESTDPVGSRPHVEVVAVPQ